MCPTATRTVNLLMIFLYFSNQTFSLSSSLPGLFGFVFGSAGMMVYDGQRVREAGMFQGYNTITYTVVVLQV